MILLEEHQPNVSQNLAYNHTLNARTTHTKHTVSYYEDKHTVWFSENLRKNAKKRK